VEKTFTLTLDEFLEVLDQDISPKRTIAPGLILMGLATAAFWILVLWIGVDRYKVSLLHILMAVSVAVAAIGAAMWRWEGRRSVRRQSSIKGVQYAQWLTPRTFKLDSSGWSVTCENKEDHRSATSLKMIKEGEHVVALVTDTLHVVPKRVLTPQELVEIQSLIAAPSSMDNPLEPIPLSP